MSIAAVLLFQSPEVATIVGIIALILALKVLRNERSTPATRRNSKIALGITVIAFFLAFVSSLANSDAPTESNSTSSQRDKIEQSRSQTAFNPAEHVEMESRNFALLAKDAAAHKGDKIIVYGVVTQFDSNTGSCGFRADVAPSVQNSRWDYSENAFITGKNPQTCAFLKSNVVADDTFKAWVQVEGTRSYSTMIGGTATALELDALQVQVTGQNAGS